jgi:hypothetical protein
VTLRRGMTSPGHTVARIHTVPRGCKARSAFPGGVTKRYGPRLPSSCRGCASSTTTKVLWRASIRLEELAHPPEVLRREAAPPGLGPLKMLRQCLHGALAPAILLDAPADHRADLPIQLDELDVHGARGVPSLASITAAPHTSP